MDSCGQAGLALKHADLIFSSTPATRSLHARLILAFYTGLFVFLVCLSRTHKPESLQFTSLQRLIANWQLSLTITSHMRTEKNHTPRGLLRTRT